MSFHYAGGSCDGADVSNDPFPTAAMLRVERRACLLLSQQSRSTEAFQVFVRNFLTALQGSLFPLGSPAEGCDLDDIEACLIEWLRPRSRSGLEELAMDMARRAESRQ